MSKIQCKRCDETKDAAEMIIRAGKPSTLCRSCFAASFKGRKKGGGASKSQKTLVDVVEKVTRRAKPATPAKPNGALEIEQSYGCRAHWEDEYLHVEQDQVDDEGNAVLARLMLTRSDLQRLVEWAA